MICAAQISPCMKLNIIFKEDAKSLIEKVHNSYGREGILKDVFKVKDRFASKNKQPAVVTFPLLSSVEAFSPKTTNASEFKSFPCATQASMKSMDTTGMPYFKAVFTLYEGSLSLEADTTK